MIVALSELVYFSSGCGYIIFSIFFQTKIWIRKLPLLTEIGRDLTPYYDFVGVVRMQRG